MTRDDVQVSNLSFITLSNVRVCSHDIFTMYWVRFAKNMQGNGHCLMRFAHAKYILIKWGDTVATKMLFLVYIPITLGHYYLWIIPFFVYTMPVFWDSLLLPRVFFWYTPQAYISGSLVYHGTLCTYLHLSLVLLSPPIFCFVVFCLPMDVILK